MEIYMIILRAIHILFGVFWVGTAVHSVLFFQPTLKAAGPAGDTVMKLYLARGGQLAIAVSGILAGLTGLLMYLKDSGGFQINWLSSSPGLAITIGGLAAFLAAILGLAVQVPVVARITAIQKGIQASGNPATPSETAELQALDDRLSTASRVGAVLLVIAVIGMAIAPELGQL